MKKTFNLIHPKKKYPRMIEAVKGEIKKYLKRERRKELPEDVDYWDFACKFGHSEEVAKKVHLAEIRGCIDEAEKLQLESFYVEILAQPGIRMKKPMAEETAGGSPGQNAEE